MQHETINRVGVRNMKYIALAAMSALLALNAAPVSAKISPNYKRAAQDRCAKAKPNALEPAQESGELRPLVIYFVAVEPHSPKNFAFICLDSDVAPRTDVYISYSAFNHRGAMPTYYGDNGPRCRTGANEEATPICASNRFVSEATTVNHVKAPVAVGYEYSGYGEIATVLTNYMDRDRKQHPRYYHVPIETISQ